MTALRMSRTRHNTIKSPPLLKQHIKLLLPQLCTVVNMVQHTRIVELHLRHLVYGLNLLRHVGIVKCTPAAVVLVLGDEFDIETGRGDPGVHEDVVGTVEGAGFGDGGAAGEEGSGGGYVAA